MEVEEVNGGRDPCEQSFRESEQRTRVDVVGAQALGERIEHRVAPVLEGSIIGESLEEALERMTVCIDRPRHDRQPVPVLDRRPPRERRRPK